MISDFVAVNLWLEMLSPIDNVAILASHVRRVVAWKAATHLAEPLLVFTGSSESIMHTILLPIAEGRLCLSQLIVRRQP